MSSSLEGRLDEFLDHGADVEDLERLLRLNPELLSSYVDQVRMHALLEWRSGRVQSVVAKPRRYLWPLAAAFLISIAGAAILFRPVPAEIAELVDSRGVAWESAPWTIGARLTSGNLRFGSGSVTLLFPSGVRMSVEGPANLRLVSAMQVRLLQGRVTARVTPAGKGFTIETPNAQVTDLGTEFGVEVDGAGQTGVVVFEGSVDLSRTERDHSLQRLTQGDAVRVDRAGQLSRIVSVQRHADSGKWSTVGPSESGVVIQSVSDNLRGLESAKCYHLVRRGLKEDSAAYVDRSYEWNAADASGLPAALTDADLLRTFNDDKRAGNLKITLTLSRPATLYVFHLDDVPAPDWLVQGFTDTGMKIGLDEGPPGMPRLGLAAGAGRSIDRLFRVWKRDVKEAGTVTLGGNNSKSMYGVAAKAIKEE